MIQLKPQRIDKVSSLHISGANPVSLRQLNAARPGYAAGVQFLHHCARYDNPAK